METAQLHQASELIEDLEQLKPRIARAGHVALFLDFDGTVSEIVPNPADAALDSEIRSTLTGMLRRCDFTVSIMSGRAVADLQKRAGLAHVIYVGNHGLEIESNARRFCEPRAEALRRPLRSLALQLKLALSDTEGVEVEDKGLTLSVHFRRVNEALHDWVRSVTFSTVARSRSFACSEGKMVMNIKPQIDWNKGHAVRWILREIAPYGALPIYLGDDTADEDAFGAMGDGITIRVGDAAATRARYVVPDVGGVEQFLQWLDLSKPHASIANSQRAGR